MAHVIYIARRSLAPFHFAGTQYTLPLILVDSNPAPRTLKNSVETMAGAVETQYFGKTRNWDVELAAILETRAAPIIEFLESTADGQTFQFDPYGSESAPRRRMNVIRSDEGHSERRVLKRGTGGDNDYWSYGFQVREV